MVRTDNFGYDRRGILVDDPDRTYRYDIFNRLIGKTDKTGGAQHSFRYDALGRRIVKDSTRFVHFGNRLVEEAPDNAAWSQRYLYGSEGALAFDLLESGTTQRRFHTKIMPESVLLVTDASGSPVESYGYDAFGVPSAYAPPARYSLRRALQSCFCIRAVLRF